MFEQYYPGKNIFIVQISRNEPDGKHVMHGDNVYFIKLTTTRGLHAVTDIALRNNITCIVVHYLTFTKAAIALKLKRRLRAKLFWIFYGADLYEWLNKHHNYVLEDREVSGYPQDPVLFSYVKKLHFLMLHGLSEKAAYLGFINECDRFCFWNELDFELVNKHFRTNARFSYFLHWGLLGHDLIADSDKDDHLIMINHSASRNGNHATILHKIAEFDQSKKLSIVCPLSYGDEIVRKQTIEIGASIFGDRFDPITDYLPMAQYYALIGRAGAAVFGNRRQEGAGNVFYLLGSGTKVFLREDNNMLKWLRQKGFLVFSFERDLSSYESLMPLSREHQEHNRRTYQQVFGQVNCEAFMISLSPDI